ncbi:MAG: zinc ribbon domain-containing protein [candidate division NC10 bacterium]|nr:zinc ribbon domain-containing protein [candidate division NC10 bacterium]
MPIFEFNCQACGADFEKLVRSSNPSVECPSCGSIQVKKKFSVFGCKAGDRFVSSASSNASCSGCSRGSCQGCS